jgi:WD40 repeat protein
MLISPYKFLDSYSKEDRDIFFGRDKEIRELYSRVFESRILIVYGTSGTGKTSLINCGLANRFNDSDWLPVTIRRGNNINRSFFDSLERIGITKISDNSKKSSGNKTTDIVKKIRSVYLDNFKPLFLIFDQFEELFIFGNSEEKDELIKTIKTVIDSQLQCRFIFSVREEYLGGLTEFEKIIPSFLANRIRIEKMTRQNAIQVIEGPCRLTNIKVEPGFSELLLERLNPDKADVELTWLQVFLDKVFRMASNDGKNINELSLDLFIRTGEVKDLLGSFLEEQISQLDDPEMGLIVLKSFVSVKGTKLQISEEEVIGYSRTFGQNTNKEIVKSLIQKFIRLRILRDKDESDRYELRHDSLAAKIYEKITLVEKELLEVKQFLANAWNIYEKRKLYLTPGDLKYIAPYEERLFLSEDIQGFISGSKRFIHKAKRRRQNVLISVAAITIIVLSFFSIWALKEKSNAIDQQQIAEAQKNIAFKARETAEAAQLEAQKSRVLAERDRNLADSAALVAKLNEKEALRQRELSRSHLAIAEKNAVMARNQEEIANYEKLKAEKAGEEALNAERRALQLSFLSIAQNIALRSLGMENNLELRGLLAVQAFVFNIKNNGKAEDPIIYEALSKALLTLDSSRHFLFSGSPNEIRVLRGKENGVLLSADLDGFIRTWNREGRDSIIYSLPFQTPVNFISSNKNGNIIITQHDNNDLMLSDLVNSSDKNLNYQILSGHGDYIRTNAFSEDGKYLATAARDSIVIIWDLKVKPAAKLTFLKTLSGVRSIVFCSSDSLIMAQEDGTILLWNIAKDVKTTIYSATEEKPLCLAWSKNRNILAAGYSNGSLLIFDLNNNKVAEPASYKVHTSGIDLITFNADFSLLATSGWDKTIKFYNYQEFFEKGNAVGGSKHIKNINCRIRSLIFTADNKLVAGLSDRSIRIWETSSEKLASLLCSLVTRNMTPEEWDLMVGADIPYEPGCFRNP